MTKPQFEISRSGKSRPYLLLPEERIILTGPAPNQAIQKAARCARSRRCQTEWYQRMTACVKCGQGRYSVLKLVTGFALAAFAACSQMVISANAMTIAPPVRNIAGDKDIR
jgi:hypothetical protein